MSRTGGEKSPIVSSLSPDVPSPPQEVLDTERLEREGELDSRGLHVKVENRETTAVATAPMLPPQPSSRVRRLNVKMSSAAHVMEEVGPMPEKFMVIKEAPKTVKALLATGILEGFPVRYINRSGKVLLTGRINDTGVQCDCKQCRGKQTVNATSFELHAGSLAKHATMFIYIDNGKNLHEVIETGRNAAKNERSVSEALYEALGPEPDKVPKNGSARCQSEHRQKGDCSVEKVAAMSSPNPASASSPQVSPNLAAAPEPSHRLSSFTGSNILSEESEKENWDRERSQEKDHVIEEIKLHVPSEIVDARLKLIRRLPEGTEELLDFPVDWNVYDKNDLDERMRPWISKKIAKLVGDDLSEGELTQKNDLVDALVNNSCKYVTARSLLEVLKPQWLDDDAEKFVSKMWRKMVHEGRLIETCLEGSKARAGPSEK